MLFLYAHSSNCSDVLMRVCHPCTWSDMSWGCHSSPENMSQLHPARSGRIRPDPAGDQIFFLISSPPRRENLHFPLENPCFGWPGVGEVGWSGAGGEVGGVNWYGQSFFPRNEHFQNAGRGPGARPSGLHFENVHFLS